MLVIPNVMGIFTYSPPLDTWGNSSRGVEFCEVTLTILPPVMTLLSALSFAYVLR